MNMNNLEKIKNISVNILIEERYINGNIDKFIECFEEPKKDMDLVEILFSDENEKTKDYLRKMPNICRKLELITEVLKTPKIEQNREDLIKLSAEILMISQEIIELGKVNDNE